MRPHLRYASYVVRHKWFVLRAGLRTGAPLWRLLIHDWSKMTLAEWGPYVHSFYGPELTAKVRADYDVAWLHHQHRNPHHWQHWILREGDGSTKALPIPLKFVREMVADWMGAGRAITGRWEVREWYEANREKIILAPEARLRVEHLIYGVAREAR